MRGIFNIDNTIMSGVMKIFDTICLGLLWLLFSLPLVTIGASSTALYATVYKYLRRGEGHLWRTFWNAFRENLCRSTALWLAAAAVCAVLFVDALVFRVQAINGSPLGMLYWLVLLLCCIAVTWLAYLFAYAARFNGNVKDVLRFSLLLMALHPIRAIQVFLPLLCAALLIAIGPGILPVIPAAVCWINSITLEKVFLLHMRPEDAKKTAEAENNL